MCKAFQEMEDEARMQGMQQGTLLGEARFGQLIKKMIEVGRNTEILAVTENPEVRNRLYQEFALV